MTVTANTTRNDYTAGSAQSVYNYTFQLNEAADVDVYLDGVKQTLNTHYTVQNVGNASGGTITFTLVDANNNPIHPTQGAVINIVMAMDLDRDTNYQPSGAFLAADVNNDFDRLWHASNQQQTAINRSLRLQDTDVTTSSMELPLKDARKGKLLAFNASTGDPEATSNNQSNWDAAYNDKINSASFSGSTLTLGQQDGGTITASHTPYLPIAGGTLTGDVEFGANKAKFTDLEIYGTIGNNSVIKETGSGSFFLQGADVRVQNATNTEDMIKAEADGAVTLYYNGNPKLATTNGGISVTGTLTATGYNDSNWNAAYNDKINSASFNTSTGVLTLTQQDNGTVTVDLDNRYLTSFDITTQTDPKYLRANASDTTTGTITAAGLIAGGLTYPTSDGSSNQVLVTNGNGTLSFANQSGGGGGSSQWTTSGSDIYYNSGNVGIGTSSPDKLLDLESSTNPTVRLSSSKSGTFTDNEVMSSLEFHSKDASGAGAGVRSAIRSLSTNQFGSRTELTFSTTDASTLDVEAMRIDSDGNVLVGTADNSPVGNNVAGGVGLFPNGSGQFSRDGGTPLLLNRKTSGGTIVDFRKDGSTVGSIGTVGGDSYFQHNGTGIRLWDGNEAITPCGASGATANGTRSLGASEARFKDLYLSGGVKGNNLTFSGNGSTEHARIDSSGNVGIGTSSPSANLHVDAPAPEFRLSQSGTAKVRLRTTGDNYINTGQNLGIGTSSPASEVDISKASGGDSALSLTSTGVQRHQIIQKGTGDGSLVFYNQTANAERMRIDSSGNLLVGKTNTTLGTVGIENRPDGRFTSTRSGNTNLVLNRLASDGSLIDFRRDGTTVGSIGSRAGLVTYITSGGAYSGLDFGADINPMKSGALSDGQVNLGASGQRFKDLYLSGKVYGDGSELTNLPAIANVVEDTTPQLGGDLDCNSKALTGATKYISNTGTNYNPAFSFSASTSTGMYQPASGAIGFSTNTSERMRITSSGNIGIGTTTPLAKLHVNGQSRASNFYATNTGSQIHNAGFMGGAGLLLRHSVSSSSTTFQQMLEFRNFSYGVVGSIKSNGSATQYNTSSDERLKENIQDSGDAGSKIDAIQIRQFDWKGSGEHQDFGVIAQELQTVAPEAVSEGYTEDDIMGVDYSKLVPTLIKEIQTLRNRVAQLENN